MTSFDRDTELERRQIQEISLNVARRLLNVLERRHTLPPAVAADIAAGARTIADMQRDIDDVMNRLPEHQPLEMAVLTHVLECHSRALSLIEDLEAQAGSRLPQPGQADPERTHAALIATAREIEREVRRYETAPAFQPPTAPFPSQQHLRPAGLPAPQPYAAQPQPRPDQRPAPQLAVHTARGTSTSPSTQGRPPTRTSLPSNPEPEASAAPKPRAGKVRALAFSPVGATALVAGVAILAASLAGALSLALSTDDGSRHATALPAPGQKFDGRLSQEDATPTSGSDSLIVSPPKETAGLVQPYLVVIATRRSTEELEQDFRYFKETHPKLLGSARGRVDTVQSQDGKTWYRLSLIPPRSQEEAASLCTELKTAGLTECWIKPLPIGQTAG